MRGAGRRRRPCSASPCSVLLLVAVAVASTGSVPAGAGGASTTRGPAPRRGDQPLHGADGGRNRHLGLSLLDPQGGGRAGDRDPEPPQPLGDARDIRSRIRPACPLRPLALGRRGDPAAARARINSGPDRGAAAGERRPRPLRARVRDGAGPGRRRSARDRHRRWYLSHRARRRRLGRAPMRCCPCSPTCWTRPSTICAPRWTRAGP